MKKKKVLICDLMFFSKLQKKWYTIIYKKCLKNILLWNMFFVEKFHIMYRSISACYENLIFIVRFYKRYLSKSFGMYGQKNIYSLFERRRWKLLIQWYWRQFITQFKIIYVRRWNIFIFWLLLKMWSYQYLIWSRWKLKKYTVYRCRFIF